MTPVYKDTPGFRHIEINEFRQGSVIANYSVIISASTNLTSVRDYILTSVIPELKNVTIYNVSVDSSDLNDTMYKELDAYVNIDICSFSLPKPCPYGFNCKGLGAVVLCSDKCDDQFCVHGTCYVDHEDESIQNC
ncbi:hypothetical protein ACJMK2_014434, partial [Sinanodonta woodiana]